VKNKRVTHIRANKKTTEIEHIYDTEKKNEIPGMMHAQRDSTNKLSAKQMIDVKIHLWGFVFKLIN